MHPSVIAMIPARLESERFPGKVLLPLEGKPLLYWVVKGAFESNFAKKVIVATDNEEIMDVAEEAGAIAVMTSSECQSGTDRLAEVVSNFSFDLKDDDLIVNIQGDEPLITGEVIDAAVKPLFKSKYKMGTLGVRFSNIKEYQDPNVVKVAVNEKNEAITFTRKYIPDMPDDQTLEVFKTAPLFRHIGLYVYRKSWLLKYAKLPKSPGEIKEKLEQLRALENDVPIYVTETNYRSIGVDVPEHVPEVERLLKEKRKGL